MSDVKNDSNSSFLAGFVVGGLVGAAIALVFAPQNGGSTRASFGNRAVTLNKTVNQTAAANGHVDSDIANGVVQDHTRRVYEPPQIILEEDNGASAPPSEE